MEYLLNILILTPIAYFVPSLFKMRIMTRDIGQMLWLHLSYVDYCDIKPILDLFSVDVFFLSQPFPIFALLRTLN